MKSTKILALLACSGLVLSAPLAQTKVKAETGLLGIKLYDSGITVAKKFGSPTDILAVQLSLQSGAAGGGGGGGFAGAPGGGGGGGGGGRAVTPGVWEIPPLSMGQMGVVPANAGPPDAGGGGGLKSSDAGGGAGGGGTATQVQYVRWIYRLSPSNSVNFVLNKFNKVVQIEVIGISNPRAKTSKGIRLGSTLSQVIKAYGNPDGYDVGQDYFMVRFLQHYKVAFRFTRESANKPYRVTAIVVSAGKG
ncbi:MAG TPA: hypothetical protein VNK96_06475 [Fimbriimonadales bacterium]|nr:hypothetical protein [Fimbriimonadales bacterium]